MWRSLYPKGPANAFGSLLRCLLAMAMMVGLVSGVAAFSGHEFVFGRPEWVRMRTAERNVAAIAGAYAHICRDTGIASIALLFDTADAVADNVDPGPVERFFAVMRHGRHADAPIKPTLRDALADSYFDVVEDPWGQPYRVVWPAEDAGSEYRAVWVWSVGADGEAVIQPGGEAVEGADDIASWQDKHPWRSAYE